ncbi:MAG TPA: GIY-YIG nuclease family protein [Candidatus Sulfotelmatobacter sp.]
MKDQSVFYVYALKDPRFTPARPFYIGKGAGTRAWDHELRVDQSAKGDRIRQVHATGQEVLTVKLVEGLSEAEALRIEAELISAFGTEDGGGLLTNAVIPKGVVERTNREVIVPTGAIEKAQIALNHLKSAVFETTKANKDGLTNYDVAKCLGLQSDYGGGSKNYLSYSVLGILMREGRIKRLQNKKHVAAVK